MSDAIFNFLETSKNCYKLELIEFKADNQAKKFIVTFKVINVMSNCQDDVVSENTVDSKKEYTIRQIKSDRCLITLEFNFNTNLEIGKKYPVTITIDHNEEKNMTILIKQQNNVLEERMEFFEKGTAWMGALGKSKPDTWQEIDMTGTNVAYGSYLKLFNENGPYHIDVTFDKEDEPVDKEDESKKINRIEGGKYTSKSRKSRRTRKSRKASKKSKKSGRKSQRRSRR